MAVALIAASLLTLPPAQSVGEDCVNSALGISLDADFVTSRGQRRHVRDPERARTQRADEPTKAFATWMIAAHKKTTEELKSSPASANIERRAAGDAFDNAYTARS